MSNGIKLTEKGKKRYDEIWSNIKDEKYLLLDNKDSIKVSLSEISKIIEKRSMIEVLYNISEEEIINFDSENTKKNELVGRDEEIKELEKSVDMLKDSYRTTHFIVGSTGIEKPRLSIEIKNMADSKSIDFIRGRCSVEEYKPYKPFRESLNKFIKSGREINDDKKMVVDSKEKRVDVKDKEMFDALKKSTFFETTPYLR